MKLYRQMDETDCGAACLATVASHYGLTAGSAVIREWAGTDRVGTSLAGLAAAAERMGFDANPMEGSVESLAPDLPVPFIAHLRKQNGEMYRDHYVVVRKVTDRRVLLHDPDPDTVSRWLPLEVFCRDWTGYVLFLSPGTAFRPGNARRNNLIRFIPVLKRHSKDLFLTSLAAFLLVVLGFLSAAYSRYIIDDLIYSKAQGTLLTLSVGMILMTLCRGFLELCRGELINNFSFKIDADMILSYLGHILRLPMGFFESRKTGEIISRIEDARKVREVVSEAVISVFLDIVMILLVTPVLYAFSPSLFMILVVTVPLSLTVFLVYTRLYKKMFRKLLEQNAELQSTVVEAVAGASTIKAFNAQTAVYRLLENRGMGLIWTARKAQRMEIHQKFFGNLIENWGNTLVFWIGSYAIMKGTVSLGTLISFTALSVFFVSPLQRLLRLQSKLQEGFVAADRLFSIMDLEKEADGTSRDYQPAVLKGDIEVSGIRFRYGSRKSVFDSLSFTIRSGSKVAFVGPSGCGKTTLAKLLLKFYDPEEGSVFMNGFNLRDMDPEIVRNRIGYVPQDIYLFSGTIAENIALNKPNCSYEKIVEAARLSGADEFICELPDRYFTLLGERGATLSGGERQRLALARALIEHPDLMIFDEATSQLDPLSERKIMETIDRLGSLGTTTILVAHRLSTIKECDRIFVLDQGTLREAGTHKELLSNRDLYYRMWTGGVI